MMIERTENAKREKDHYNHEFEEGVMQKVQLFFLRTEGKSESPETFDSLSFDERKIVTGRKTINFLALSVRTSRLLERCLMSCL